MASKSIKGHKVGASVFRSAEVAAQVEGNRAALAATVNREGMSAEDRGAAFRSFFAAAPSLTIKVGRRSHPVTDYAHASRMTLAAVDALMRTGARMSDTFTPPLIFDGKKQVAYVSQNGRVWAGHPRDWKAGATPLCDAQYPEDAK